MSLGAIAARGVYGGVGAAFNFQADPAAGITNRFLAQLTTLHADERTTLGVCNPTRRSAERRWRSEPP